MQQLTYSKEKNPLGLSVTTRNHTFNDKYMIPVMCCIKDYQGQILRIIAKTIL